MTTNRRSIEEKYVEWILKEYDNWTLLLNTNQRYLGRVYVWLAQEGEMQRFSDLTLDQYMELMVVIQDYEYAMAELWRPEHMNYAWLGNFFHEHGGHGHMHLIPRYQGPRVFQGTTFADGKWGKNYAPSEPFEPTYDLLFQIRDAIKAKL